ncbi:GNAT family N-acetyltransferase [Zobellia amurskyensis]|uniref:GNAT family N-acetyltransferase n=1 Tax=Zobellia amurskyensis TaxID=248905 RepID=A0A7X2ZRP2_9FLAO|nr:GNAT family N-acetyltransferase [Zobellia amurskyensis]MUH35168.1 GNAT family N-acetyltransferase [Zobellia amurskyensis]
MKIKVKSFARLTKLELYHILRIRSEVFVVEQDCVYQDIDGKDEKALHVIATKNGEIVAYTRIFAPGDYFEEASIGRVVVKSSERKYGYGKDIMKASIKAVEEHFNTPVMKVSAQLYLERFYHTLGFDQVGEGYLEDGIPHIGMVRK